MAPTKTSLTVAACAVLASSSNAFMIPGRSMSMTAEKPSKAPAAKAAAAAVLASAAILQGAVCTAPVDAAMFDVAPATELQQNVGLFGSKSATEAAKPDSSKYDVQNKGSFAKKQSAGAVDYGSPKGTDFGDLAGKAAGVANEKAGTNFNTNSKKGSSSTGAASKSGSNPADVASQKARKLAQKGQNVASNIGSSVTLSLHDKAGIADAVELGKQSPKLGGGSNWGNNDVVADATGKAKDITTKGDLKDALTQGAKTWSGKGNAFSTPAAVATKPFGDIKKEQGNMQESTGRESRKETLSRATASIKNTIEDVNQGGGDQYKGINPEQ